MVLRPASDLEPVALDRVGEDHGRAVGSPARRRSAPSTSRQVVAAEVADERPDRPFVCVEQPLQARPRPPRRARRGASRDTLSSSRRRATGTARSASRRCGAGAPRRPPGRTPRAAGART